MRNHLAVVQTTTPIVAHADNTVGYRCPLGGCNSYHTYRVSHSILFIWPCPTLLAHSSAPSIESAQLHLHISSLQAGILLDGARGSLGADVGANLSPFSVLCHKHGALSYGQCVLWHHGRSDDRAVFEGDPVGFDYG